MSTVVERMRARLADPTADHGSPCRHCGVVAVACQIIFVESYHAEGSHCCTPCRSGGAARLHVVEEGGHHG